LGCNYRDHTELHWEENLQKGNKIEGILTNIQNLLLSKNHKSWRSGWVKVLNRIHKPRRSGCVGVLKTIHKLRRSGTVGVLNKNHKSRSGEVGVFLLPRNLVQ